MKVPELAGATEIAELLGVTRQRVQQLAAKDPEFPAPAAVLKMGKVWVLDDVRAWAKRAGRGEAVLTYQHSTPSDHHRTEPDRPQCARNGTR